MLNRHHPLRTARASDGHAPAGQRGASLLEVLVAILIMSFGMLALAGLSVAGLQYNKMTQYQAIGAQLAADYGDRMRANQLGFLAGAYNRTAAFTGSTSTGTVPGCATAGVCTAAEIAAIDIAEVTNALRQRLPSGSMYVVRDTVNTLAADLWILWIEPDLRYDTGSGNDLSVRSSTECPAAAIASLPTGVATPRCMYYRVSQ